MQNMTPEQRLAAIRALHAAWQALVPVEGLWNELEFLADRVHESILRICPDAAEYVEVTR